MKNAITVIDQELIDRFALMVSVKEDHEIVSVTAGELFELIDMAKDLIEINAELTKREQKYKNKLGLCANHLLLLLGVDDIEDEEDKASIHDKANEFLIEIDKILKD